MLGSCYGALGILRLLDDNASYTALLGQSIAYYDIYVALSRHLYRTQGLAPQLTMTDSVAAGLVCAGLVTENEHVAARAGEHLRFIEVEPEAVDSRYWSDRTYEPFAGRLLTFRNGDLPWETFVAESGGVYKDVAAAWSDAAELKKALEAACDYHAQWMIESDECFPEFTASPFDLIPWEIMAALKLRAAQGLVAPTVDHPLMFLVPKLRPELIKLVYDDLLTDVCALVPQV